MQKIFTDFNKIQLHTGTYMQLNLKDEGEIIISITFARLGLQLPSQRKY